MGRKTSKTSKALARRSTKRGQTHNPGVGVTQLRKDADQAVGENSKDIADALLEKAKAGNASSARLLVDLADGADWRGQSETASGALLQVVRDWKKAPPMVELEVTTNPPELRQQLQLTDGKK